MTDSSLVHRLFRISRSRPEHPLIEVWEEREGKIVRGLCLSYREVRDLIAFKSLEFSRELHKSDKLVGLLLPPGPEFVVSDLALMLAGRTPVLIDHLLPPESVKGFLTSFGIRTLVTEDQGLIASLEGCGEVRVLSPALLKPLGAFKDPETLLAGVLPEGPRTVAHLLLTSGTTGEPKGVPLTHGNLLFDADAALTYGVFTERDRILSVLPLHHSYPFMTGILLPLSAGATILFPPDLSPAALGGVLEKGEVTIFPAVPLLWERFHRRIEDEIDRKPPLVRSLIRRVLLPLSFYLRRRFGSRLGAFPFGAVRRRFGPRMKALFSGGAALKPEIARDLFAMGLTMLEGYGLTETSPVVSVNTPFNWRVGTVGPPLPGVEIRVLAPEEGRPGGRVLVRGPNVAECWWLPGGERRSLCDPDGWFDTGDLGFFSGGHLVLVGREKEVIVLPSGKNIFPEPVEQALVKKANLSEAAVLLEGKALVALVRPEPSGLSPLFSSAIEELNREVPAHSRIASFEIVEDPLPRTRLGKLRRFMLPGIYREIRSKRLSSQTMVRVPDSPLVTRIKERIRAVTGVEGEIPDGAQLEADLGVDSLARIELLQEIEEILGQSVPDTMLSGILTVGDLLERITGVGPGSAPQAEILDRPLEEAEEAMIPLRGKTRKGELSLADKWLYYALRFLGGVLFGIRWPRYVVVGAPEKEGIALPSGPFVIVSNLSGPLDPLILALSLPMEVLTRTLIWGIPAKDQDRLRPVKTLLGLLPVDDQKALTGLRLAVHLLRTGHTLVVFPEGEASPDGQIGFFRPGIGRILRKISCPVLPVRISGSFSAWPSRRRFPRPRRIVLRIGSLIDPEGFRTLDEGGIVRFFEGMIRKLSDRY